MNHFALSPLPAIQYLICDLICDLICEVSNFPQQRFLSVSLGDDVPLNEAETFNNLHRGLNHEDCIVEGCIAEDCFMVDLGNGNAVMKI